MQPSYLLIGDGRVGTHFGRYFRLLGFSVRSWSRKQSHGALAELAKASSHILCLISDPAIEIFLSEKSALFSGKTVVHASGSLLTPLAAGAHPLMTFAAGADYDLETYRSIPFIIEKGRVPFSKLLPGLPNPHFEIDSALKPLYHALCVMSGNFTVLLWQKAFRDFETRLGLPSEALLPYLDRVTANLARSPGVALTGPLARGDVKTIETHLRTLGTDPFADIYRAFVATVEADMRSRTATEIQPGRGNANGGDQGRIT